jgi:hypothetical protein
MPLGGHSGHRGGGALEASGRDGAGVGRPQRVLPPLQLAAEELAVLRRIVDSALAGGTAIGSEPDPRRRLSSYNDTTEDHRD